MLPEGIPACQLASPHTFTSPLRKPSGCREQASSPLCSPLPLILSSILSFEIQPPPVHRALSLSFSPSLSLPLSLSLIRLQRTGALVKVPLPLLLLLKCSAFRSWAGQSSIWIRYCCVMEGLAGRRPPVRKLDPDGAPCFCHYGVW